MQENNNIDRINELVSSFFEKGLSEEERTELKKLLELRTINVISEKSTQLNWLPET